MRYKIYTTSEKAWAGMLEAIKSAKRSIYLEMYIFDADTHGYNFTAELEKAAIRGCKTIIVLDVIGSHTLGAGSIAKLRAAGVEVLFFSFFLRRTHRKILIVDEMIAFIGGVNIKHRYNSWRDLQIRVTGRVVRSILNSFIRVYIECGGVDSVLRDYKPRSRFYRTKMWFVEHGIGRRRHELQKYYKEHIDSAKKSIVLVTPYLLPPRWLIAHIHQAILRGVAIEIVLPRATDHRVANRLNSVFVSFMSELGAKCYFLNGMNHAKAMLIDGQEGVIGSQNLDPLSFDWNMEAGVFFHEKNTVRQLEKIISDWKSEAVIYNPEHHSPHWYDIFLALILRLFGFLPLW